MKKLFLFVFALIYSASTLAQVQSEIFETQSAFGAYPELKNVINAVPLQTMPAVDLQALQSIALSQGPESRPFRFGYGFDVDYTLEDGVWETNDSTRIWSLRIASEGAYSLNFIFDTLHLADQAKLYIFNTDGSMLYGPVTSAQNPNGNHFLTDLVKGDQVVIQIIEPLGFSSSKAASFLKISRVVHAYVNTFPNQEALAPPSVGAAQLTCHQDVNCYPTWDTESNAIALVLLSSGDTWCSGSLLNNTAQDYRPYFLTAFHCIDVGPNPGSPVQDGVLNGVETNNAQNWSFRFRWKKSTCGGSTATGYITYDHATFRAAWQATDFALMELVGQVINTNGQLSLLGWDRTGSAPASGMGIHHPNGDLMKILLDNQSLSKYSNAITWNGGAAPSSPANTHWYSVPDAGAFEGGSSGSPLFDGNKRVVGQLHGGYFYCPPSSIAYYGRLDTSWTGGGTNTTRLSNWLNPSGGSATTLNTIKTPSLSGSTTPVCSGSSVTFTVNSPISPNFTWDKSSNLTLVSASGNSATFSGSGSGAAWVRILVGGVEAARKTFTIVSSTPWHSNSSATCTTYGSNTFTGQATVVTASAGIDQFEWSSSNPNWTISTHPMTSGNELPMSKVLITRNTTVSTIIRYRAHNACGWDDDWTPVIIPGYPYYSASAYPNPVNSTLTVDIAVDQEMLAATLEALAASSLQSSFSSALSQNPTFSIKLYDNNGTLVKQITSAEGTVTLDVSRLPSGTYFLHVHDGTESEPVTQTVIVSH
jgi:hypothetical protein